jgi:hypothetical protein
VPKSSFAKPAHRAPAVGIIPRKTTILLIRRGLKPGISAESGWPKLWHSSWCPPIGPYSELKLVLPSKTPATADNGFVSSMRRAG